MYVDPKTGEEMTFSEIAVALLVEGNGRTVSDAESLVKRHPQVMVNAMMAGRGTEYRATAMALEIKEGEEGEP